MVIGRGEPSLPEPALFDHERLDAYQLTLECLALVLPALEAIPPGHGKLIDQLRRAATSVPLNIAEGSGKPTGPDRRGYYAIARGSAMECAAILDVFRLLRLLDDQIVDQAKAGLQRVVAMLSKLCR